MPFYKNGRKSGLNLPWLERAVCWKRQEVGGMILITHWNEASRVLPVLTTVPRSIPCSIPLHSIPCSAFYMHTQRLFVYTVLNGWADTTCLSSLSTHLAPIPLFPIVPKPWALNTYMQNVVHRSNDSYHYECQRRHATRVCHIIQRWHWNINWQCSIELSAWALGAF